MNIKAAFKKEFPFFMAAPAVLWQLLFFYIPVSVVLYTSFVQPGDEFFFNRLTFDYIRTFFSSLYVRIVLHLWM